jgi:hypothetical protein
MKASPRTSIVLATTLLAGGVVAGTVSQDVLTPTNSGFLGNAGSFFSTLDPATGGINQIADSAETVGTEPVAVAKSNSPVATPNEPVTGEVRLAIDPSTTVAPTLEPNPEPVLTPEPVTIVIPEQFTEPSPEPSVSPSSISAETLENDGELTPEP